MASLPMRNCVIDISLDLGDIFLNFRAPPLQDVKEASLSRFMSDLAADHAKNPSAALNDRWESEEENEDLDVDIIDQSTPFDGTFSAYANQVISEERWPGQYVDVTYMRRQDEQIHWPRPG